MCRVSGKGRRGQFFFERSNRSLVSRKWRGLETFPCKVLAIFFDSPADPAASPKPSASRELATTDAILLHPVPACGSVSTAHSPRRSKSLRASESAKLPTSRSATSSRRTLSSPVENASQRLKTRLGFDKRV